MPFQERDGAFCLVQSAKKENWPNAIAPQCAAPSWHIRGSAFDWTCIKGEGCVVLQ